MARSWTRLQQKRRKERASSVARRLIGRPWWLKSLPAVPDECFESLEKARMKAWQAMGVSSVSGPEHNINGDKTSVGPLL